MHLKKGDKVIVIAGKEKGKTSTVTKTLREENKVILEGLNLAKKHIKPKKTGDKGGMVDIAMPIHASNVKLAEKKTKVAKTEKTEKKPVAKKAAKK
jgi:large subunit ribosomal protein L24